MNRHDVSKAYNSKIKELASRCPSLGQLIEQLGDPTANKASDGMKVASYKITRLSGSLLAMTIDIVTEAGKTLSDIPYTLYLAWLEWVNWHAAVDGAGKDRYYLQRLRFCSDHSPAPYDAFFTVQADTAPTYDPNTCRFIGLD